MAFRRSWTQACLGTDSLQPGGAGGWGSWGAAGTSTAAALFALFVTLSEHS